MPGILDELERRTVKQAYSIWMGYAAFCDESAGVSADRLSAVVLEPVIERIEDMKLRAERLGVEADENLLEEMREKLGETWRMVEERGV